MTQSKTAGYSLRKRLQDEGMSEAHIRINLKAAANVLAFVPGVDLRRFNPRRPMSGIHEG